MAQHIFSILIAEACSSAMRSLSMAGVDDNRAVDNMICIPETNSSLIFCKHYFKWRLQSTG